MNVMTRALALVAPFVLGLATAHADVPTTDVSYEVFDFYNPSEQINDSSLRVTAHNNATGENFIADERSDNTFTLPVGNYTFTGRGDWCYLAPATYDITVNTHEITLYVGCE